MYNKPSYNQSQLVWINEDGLRANISKMLKLGKQMPVTIQHFYMVILSFNVSNMIIIHFI